MTTYDINNMAYDLTLGMAYDLTLDLAHDLKFDITLYYMCYDLT